MKMYFSKFSILAAGICGSLVLLGSGISYAAGSASLSLSPSVSSVNNGASFSVSISENGNGSAVNVVTAKLSYNPSLLQFVGVNCGGLFANSVSPSGGAGSVTLTCYTAAGSAAPTDSQYVGSVNFKALAGSGSATVSSASGTIVASNSTNVWNGALASSTVALTTPAVAPPSSTGSTGGNSSTGSSSSGSKSNGKTISTPTGTTGSSTKTTSPAKTPDAKSTAKNTKSQSSHSSPHTINGRFVATTKTSPITTTYFVLGLALGCGATMMIVFRKQLLATAKTVSTKYSISRK